MNNIKILISDSNEQSKKVIHDILARKGYKIYQSSDGAGTIRICRSIFPDLVIIDTNLLGINPYETARIIEDNKLSNVIFVTSSPSREFYENLKNMNIFTYITKPISLEQLYSIVEFSIANINKINFLEKKIEKLENTLEGRKKVDKAKGILMKKYNITEDEAYKLLRKSSMNECIAIEKIAEKVIKQME